MRRELLLSSLEQSRAEQSRAEQSRAEQSRAEQSRAEQSRAEHGLTVPFLRLAIAGRLKLHITFEMDDRRILMGLVYPVRFGGYYHIKINHKEAI